MGATQIEFRLRMIINAAVVVCGFWSPWIEGWGIGRRISLMEWLATEVSRIGRLPFTGAIAAAIILASLVAAAGAALRVWGTAYLGPGVVNSTAMQAGTVMADGPYRHVRNPLYVGIWLMISAMSFVMPATGAIFTMCALTVFLLRLILGEEKFLTAQLGEAYLDYKRTVPRLFPQVRTNLPASGQTPRWVKGVLSELNPLGVLFILAVLSWKYDSQLMIRAFLVSLGVSLVARALIPEVRQKAA